MLRRLTVENYVLIDKLDIELDANLSIITGETGAGKSILLGALGLLLGAKNESGSLRDESRSCVVEGTFDVGDYSLESFFEENELEYEPQTIIRRMILPSGKSRAFINDMPVQLSLLRELGLRLIDIHSQHQNLVLADEQFRQRSIDTLAECGEQVAEYRTLYQEYRAAERTLEQMVAESESARKEEEWLRYNVAEFEAAALRAGELKETEAELLLLENAEQIASTLAELRNMLDAEQIGVLEQLSSAQSAMSRLSEGYPRKEEMSQRLNSVVQELKDLGETIADDSERIESNPERLQKLTERVNLIYSMCQKHRVPGLDELIALGEEFATKLSMIERSTTDIEQQRERIEKLRKQAIKSAESIHKLRERAAKSFSTKIEQALVGLGLSEAKFRIAVEPLQELQTAGMDKILFYFSANNSLEAQPIERVASGGEISRVMLVIKALLAERKSLPTIIFDEIDTGVSGRIADAMGEIIRNLSQNMQVVAITHLPQVASKGESHFVVYKENSFTKIVRLDAEQRVEEIAKMLSGSHITEAALSQAKFLLGRSELLF